MIKIQRSFPAPASLALEAKKANGKYNLADVTNQLRKDFYDKCYICEIKPVQDPEVEHRLPHKNGKYADRKFDLENELRLYGGKAVRFPSRGTCRKTGSRKHAA